MEFPLSCSSCGRQRLEEEPDHLMVTWNNGTADHFCHQDCLLDWMVAHNVTYLDPRPQPDV